ncbi:MAG TPA: SsrA-binding protein SmpB [Desulfatiglandales bacterium]|nr:SsrA-binding protein SmpB [Desulfatiglandales bacterium]
MKKDGDQKVIAVNKKASHDYFIQERLEAGIVLQGTEVKSIREGKINLKDSYAKVEGNEVFLLNCHISPYSHSSLFNHDPLRKRKLLLKKRQISKLIGKAIEKGQTVVPLKVYLKRNFVKVEIALAMGKKLYDKREDMKRKDGEKQMAQAFKARLQ